MARARTAALAVTAVLTVAALFAAVLLAGARWGGLGRAGVLPLAAAGTLAMAGYAWQGRPALPAEPTAAAAEAGDAADLLALRDRLSRGGFSPARAWIVFADGSARRGRTEAAVAILKRGLRDHPRDLDLHTALAFALIQHADGAVTPAAEFVLEQVRSLDPASPAPDFIVGEAAARADRLADALAVWTPLLARAPADARWRTDVAVRLELLRRIEAARAR